MASISSPLALPWPTLNDGGAESNKARRQRHTGDEGRGGSEGEEDDGDPRRCGPKAMRGGAVGAFDHGDRICAITGPVWCSVCVHDVSPRFESTL